MRCNKLYLVGGGSVLRSPIGPWFAERKGGIGFANYIACKTKAHALAQYNRLPIKYRQIDVREYGKKPYALKSGKEH